MTLRAILARFCYLHRLQAAAAVVVVVMVMVVEVVLGRSDLSR